MTETERIGDSATEVVSRDAESTAEPAPPLVLVADNDQNVAEILRAFLVRQALEVEIVGDGRAALERIARGGVALLVCDLDMPIMSGDALLEAMAGEPTCPPVVVVSGYVDARTAQQLDRHPAVVSILRKPFDVRRFAADVRSRLDSVRTAATGPDLFGTLAAPSDGDGRPGEGVGESNGDM